MPLPKAKPKAKPRPASGKIVYVTINEDMFYRLTMEQWKKASVNI